MNKKILLISGTPASGKDTLTNLLCQKDKRFTHFKKHKMGESGRIDDTYIFVDKETFNSMADNEEFIQYHYRYERGYAVAFSQLQVCWSKGLIPVIHVGKYENIAAFYNQQDVEICSLLLLVDKETTKERLALRHPGDEKQIAERLQSYNEERKELAELINSGDSLLFDYIINNSNSPDKTLKAIKKICF
ncbi:hypothetical protein NJD71_01450 [Psychrobacter sp. PP-21]|uniref:hypothetical protein n=1 Tax=Psychrobacter sp. PP-21 TaxID=2957503 RepID=UPI0029B7C63F|nr:hypothetical protein [Psychrobacter sp. PP-21]MDX2372788.1 hypothetical protein [Psychrobacter sp. PP-21]